VAFYRSKSLHLAWFVVTLDKDAFVRWLTLVTEQRDARIQEVLRKMYF